MLVSIVVPVRRDARALAGLLPDLIGPAVAGDVEIIVVAPHEEAAAVGEQGTRWPHVRWTTSPEGRGPQQNAGARLARGRWLWFVHADSQVPAGWLDAFHAIDRGSDIVGGSFAFGLDSPAWQARVLEWGVGLRVALFDLPYGDQGLFVRRVAFEQMGGFAPLPLMEDVELVRRLSRLGRLEHRRERLVTSARRWEREGWVRRSARNLMTLSLYGLGVSPDWLARRYDRRAREARDSPHRG